MKDIIIATSNTGKLREISRIFTDVGMVCHGLGEFPHLVLPEETGLTYHENALLKAMDIMRQSGMPCLADDSGIEITALDNQPGVHSARFRGADVSYATRNSVILQALERKHGQERAARFVCVMIFMLDSEKWLGSRGIVEGHIAMQPEGTNGFGYDPIFIPEGFQQTMACLRPEQKDRISHRGQALRRIFSLISRFED